LQYWEFRACVRGYQKKNELEDYRWSRQALWLGNFKKGTNMKKLLGYVPFSNKKKAEKSVNLKEQNDKIFKKKSNKEIAGLYTMLQGSRK
jgi:hypothetical protein